MRIKQTFVYGFLAIILALAFTVLSLTGCPDVTNITKKDLIGTVSFDNNSPKVGDTITATYSPGNGTGAQTWQWFRVDGTDVLISGVNANTYTVAAADVGKKIKVLLSFADQHGSVSATTTNAVAAAAPNSDITYTATRADGVDGATDSTAINFTFSTSVTGLTADDISVTNGTGSVTKGTLSGSGTSWSLGVTVTSAGNVTIAIVKNGIEAGPKDVTVYKEGQTAPTVTTISAVYTQGSTIIFPTTSLESLRANLTVTAAYSNGVTLPVTSYALSVSGSGTLTVGTSTVTISYEGKTTTFNVTVTAAPANKTLTDITLNTDSVKRDYNQNETLDLTGLIVTANYSDSTSAAVSYTSTSPANGSPLSTAETITVTVNYTEGTITRSNTFTVTVIDITTPTEGLAYELIDNGTAYRVRKGWVTEGVVVIPATYEGLPVTEIGSVDDNWEVAAFFNTSITSIIIPASVTSIGTSAFGSCASLATVTFVEGSQLQTIGDSAFSYCTSLTSITIPASVTSIGNSAFYGWGNPPRMTLATVTFAPGSQLQTIGDEAFCYCANLTSINIPAGVTSIGQYAFRRCTSITEITIPAGVTSVGPGAFQDWGYPQTQTIYVEGHSSWAAADTAWGYWQGGGGAVIVVYGIVSEIEITQQPARTVYLIGEQLDITGLVVTAHFNDNTTGTVTVTTANITGFDSETLGTKTLTFTYGRKTATFTVTVVGLSSIAVTRQPNKTGYLIGEQLDITGLVVIAIYGNNAITETVTVTAADITGFDSATEGTKTLTVTYNGKTATFTVTVFDPDNIIVITNTTEWNNAITTLNGQTGYYILNIGGSFNVAGSADNTFGTTANGSTLTVRLIGNGTLSLGSDGNILRAGANQTIIIDSESLILQGKYNNTTSLVYVDGSSAKLELKNGTISGNYLLNQKLYGVDARAEGGGVYVGASGTFTMSGGTISGNTAVAICSTDAVASASGGGVYNTGTFIMTGGTISGNETRADNGSSTYSYGGGVYNSGTFRIVNGTIYGSSASPSSLSNGSYSRGIYTSRASGAALYSSGTSQRGTFIGETWNSSGNISTTDYTISVVNGLWQ